VNAKRTLPTFALVACASLAVAACGSSSSSSTSSTSTSATVSAPGASVSIVTPKNGSTTSSTVAAKVTIKNFKLAPNQVGKTAVQGEGHLHFSMDGGKYDQPKYSGANGKLAKQLGVAGQYSPSVTPTVTYTGLPKGKHTLVVYLANNDHTDTGVQAKTTFTVN
jgi:ABC-type oligopeptide transport system substrate-binding subunit